MKGAQRRTQLAGVFRSAITDGNGQVDVGNLALFWLMVVVLNAIPALIILASISMGLDPAHRFDPQPLGIAIGAICAAFGAALAALGAYLRLQPQPAVSQTTTTTTEVKG